MAPEGRIRASENEAIAQALREVADLKQAQGANAFRVAAYRKAAANVEALPQSVRVPFDARGHEGLRAIPGVGPGIASAIGEMLATGRWGELERLRGTLEPALLFRAVPGIGPELARRIHDALGIDTLEALEVACHDGSLERVTGLGERRIATIRAALAEMLDRTRLRRRMAPSPADEPPVGVLLDVDREYREAAAAHALPTIAPRRFNPSHEAWLPVLHTQHGDWHFTALFSNTAQAHARGRTHDWVVLYCEGGPHAECQRTIVTETSGPLRARRVVRGREAECAACGARGSAVAAAASPCDKQR